LTDWFNLEGVGAAVLCAEVKRLGERASSEHAIPSSWTIRELGGPDLLGTGFNYKRPALFALALVECAEQAVGRIAPRGERFIEDRERVWNSDGQVERLHLVSDR
jgi:hypothetical protein